MKKLVIGLAVAVAAVAGLSSSVSAKRDAVVAPPSSDYEYFCHRTNSVKNPYVKKPFSETYKEVDGKGNNDHTHHAGPVVSTKAEAKTLKAQHKKWGDIIPPVTSYLPAGLNWDEAGMAVYQNGCNYPKAETSANIEYSVSCNESKTMIVVTLKNSGNANGVANVNGQDVKVKAGQTVVKEYSDGTQITITLDDDSEPVYDQQVKCQVGGSGGGSTENPETPGTVTAATLASAQLPSTSGANYAVLLASISAAAIAVSLGGKRLVTRFF